MKKDDFEKKIKESSYIKMDFKDIESKINYEQYIKKDKKSFSYKKHLMWGIPSLITCLCLAIILPLSLKDKPNSSNNAPILEGDLSLKNKYGWDTIYLKKEEKQEDFIPFWEDKNYPQKYPSFSLDEKNYGVVSTNVSYIDDSYIGDYIQTITLKGNDNYHPEEIHEIEGKLYQIKEITTDCAYAVQFDGDNHYYSYIYNKYLFNTLGDLKSILNLESYLSFGQGHYSYQDNKGYHLIRFDDINDSYFWDNLLSDNSLVNACVKDGEIIDSNTYTTNLLSIGVSIPCFGYSNISLGINKLGYIQTNIFDYAKTFYIGMEKVNNFMDDYFKTVKGHEIVYIDNTSSSSETNNGNIETSEGYNPTK